MVTMAAAGSGWMCSNTDGSDGLKMKGRVEWSADSHPRELNLLLPGVCTVGGKLIKP
jgi:hypothetical protein